jgi:hypothetical protein
VIRHQPFSLSAFQHFSISAFQHFSFYLMDWILDHYEIIALAVLGLASWVKRRMDVAGAEREERQAKQDMSDGEDVFDPATGWPQAVPSVPPPLVRQGPPPLMSQSPSHTVADYNNAAILKQQQDIQERLRRIRETKAAPTGGTAKATTTGGAAATRSRVSASQSHAKSVTPAKAGLRGSLRQRQEIRRAIVLREILGPPVGLR